MMTTLRVLLVEDSDGGEYRLRFRGGRGDFDGISTKITLIQLIYRVQIYAYNVRYDMPFCMALINLPYKRSAK